MKLQALLKFFSAPGNYLREVAGRPVVWRMQTGQGYSEQY